MTVRDRPRGSDSGRIRKVVDDQIEVRKRDGTIGSMNGAWAILLRVLLVISMPFYGWLAVEALASRDFRNAAAINYWTVAQQVQFQKEFFKQQQELVDEINRQAKALEERLRDHRELDHPPKWFGLQVDALARKIDSIDQKVSDNHSELEVLKAEVIRNRQTLDKVKQ